MPARGNPLSTHGVDVVPQKAAGPVLAKTMLSQGIACAVDSENFWIPLVPEIARTGVQTTPIRACMQFEPLQEQPMAQRVIRMSELASTPKRKGRLPVSPATLWRWVAEARFPQPFKLGPNTTVWDLDEVEAFVAKQAEVKQP